MNLRKRAFPPLTDPVLVEAVRAGEAWLDQHYPGWVDRVTGRIRMETPDRCVLGQVVPVTSEQVTTGFAQALLDHCDGPMFGDLGFTCSMDSNMPGLGQFEVLNALWTEVVRSRRAALLL
jgi:hypothetical protein